MPSYWVQLCLCLCFGEQGALSRSRAEAEPEKAGPCVCPGEREGGSSLPPPTSCGLNRQHEGHCDAHWGTLAYQKIERKDRADTHVRWWGLDIKNMKAPRWSLILGTNSPLAKLP